ncbi:MAG: DUF748 domain-containing protein [Candidatus Omnitrophota bacterium]|nr:DUF748 domain-containing protein [Candidatus Omnitrophota bacterium]MDZ4243368.1 DUF748 domain-containing protein [Candidatus Omnitrophota bacterium]
MNILKKILKFSGLTVAGIFLFYLFVSWAVIPLAVPWAIKSQGTKILKTPVKARSASFNPFLWRFTLKGVEVLDSDKQVLAGFDKLQVNVSFLALFKKIYRVEAFLLDGLKVNAALLPDGSINLLALAPQPAAPDAPASPAKAEESTPPAQPAALPLVVIDEIALTNGQVSFTDQSVQPNFKTTLNAIDIRVTGVSTRPDCRVKTTFQAKLDNKGAISSEALIDPFVQPLQMETTFTLDQYAMQVLTPYTGKYTGRELADGNLTLKMDYRIADNKITAGHKLLIQKFTFGNKVESKDALGLPFGLAVALLEDPQGRITITLPVKGDMSDPEFEYMHLVGQVVRNFFVKLVTKPFSFLASVIGAESGTEELGTLKFIPGRAEISDEEKAKLDLLAKGLMERPKLNLEINGTYDPQADWKAIKTEVFNKDYEQLKGETTKAETWIYQQLFQRQFGIRDLWQVNNDVRKEDGTIDEAALNEAIKIKIIDHGQPDKGALEVLAQARAKMIHDALIAAGFDQQRMSLGPVKTAQVSMDLVPLEFTLTVLGEAGEGNPQPEATEQTPENPTKNQ